MNSRSHSSISAVGTGSAHCNCSIDLDPGNAADSSRHADEESTLPSVIKEQIESKFIGKAILEYAEKRAPFYPQYPVSCLINLIRLCTFKFSLNWVRMTCFLERLNYIR